MPLSIVQFFDRLRESGVLPPGEAVSWLKKIAPDKRGQDSAPIVAKLIEAKKLTPFQVEALLANNHASLVLGDYVILSKIGAGGMGQVFKARHRRMKRLVAIKVLPSAMMSEPESIKRFEREVEAAARLSHPNIVQAHDAGEQKGIHYLVMEYVDGSDLANLVREQGPLSCEQAVNYTVQAARGLAHAHAQGIVHRDIKPANLLLDSYGTVKILDMGLARFEHPADEASEGLTQSGTLMGTVDYMSPEQALDTKNADARADMYSLGCTLYYLLTGRRMYDGDSMMKRLVAHREEPIPALAAVRPEVSPALAEVFERMVAKKPQDRFQSMNELSAALLATTRSLAGAASIAAPGEQTVGGAASGTLAADLGTPVRPPPLAPPLVAANTVSHSESRTEATLWPELLPLETPPERLASPPNGQTLSAARGVWRVFDTPLWAWAVVIDRWFGQLAGPGNVALHWVLRIGAALAATAIVALLALAAWSLASSRNNSGKPPAGDAPSTEAVSERASPDHSPPSVPASEESNPRKSNPASPQAAQTAKAPLAPAATPALNIHPLGPTRIRRGNTEIVKVTLERIGCVGPVEVRATGLPEHVACPTETLPTAQDSLDLRFFAPADASLGDTDVTLVATLGGLSASRTVRLTVAEAPGVKLTPLAAKSFKAGDSVSVPVQVEREGYTGPIQVTVAGLPATVSLKNGGTTILPGRVSGVLDFTATTSAPAAAHNLRVTASGGGFSDSQPLRLSVEGRPVVIGGGGGGGVVVGGGGVVVGRGKVGGTTTGKKPVSDLVFELDPKKKELHEYNIGNVRAGYEGKYYVLDLKRGKQTNAFVSVGSAVSDFDCEVRCRLTGNSGGLRMTLVFRDNPAPAGEFSHLTWWLNRYDQACLVRQSWDLPKPGATITTRETRISDYEAAPVRHDGWNKLKLRARGALVETYMNDKLFRRQTVGSAGYKPASQPIKFWITKDKDDEEGRLEFSEIKITRLSSS